MNANKADLSAIITKIAENLEGLKYGSASVQLRVHAGRVVDVTYTVTERTRENDTSYTKGENDER
ncbi:hypothetical protein FACS1894172_03310 [Spirochaetia bacterium]|nr:hypothetical protein FACS1894172_03310 [Spirochaetia bacterium]